jgi:hypothetical protein
MQVYEAGRHETHAVSPSRLTGTLSSGKIDIRRSCATPDGSWRDLLATNAVHACGGSGDEELHRTASQRMASMPRITLPLVVRVASDADFRMFDRQPR